MILRYGSPEEVGMCPKRIKHIETLAEGWEKSGATPAEEFLIARKGVIVSHKAYGFLAPEPNSPKLELDTIFPLASLSKPITATCIMILVEEGLIELTDSVCKHIPEFTGEGKKAVKIHHLLTHTSGIKDRDVHYTSLMKKERKVKIPDLEATQHPGMNEYLFLGYEAPLWKAPGTEMSYFSYGYDLLGEIVRRVSGKSLDAFSRERIFNPLKMKDTNYIVPDAIFSRVVRRAENLQGGTWFNTPENLKEPSGSGGVYSTALDVAIFGQMFLNGGIYGDVRILSPVTVREMTRNQTPGIPAHHDGEFFNDAFWGYGWNVHGDKRDDSGCMRSPRAFDHGGAGGVRLLVDPEYEVVWVYFPVITNILYTRNLFNNAVMCSIIE